MGGRGPGDVCAAGQLVALLVTAFSSQAALSTCGYKV